MSVAPTLDGGARSGWLRRWLCVGERSQGGFGQLWGVGGARLRASGSGGWIVVRRRSLPQPTAHRAGGRWTPPGWHERAEPQAARAASAPPEPAAGGRPPPQPAPKWHTPCPTLRFGRTLSSGTSNLKRMFPGSSDRLRSLALGLPMRPRVEGGRDPRTLGHVTHPAWQPVGLGLPPHAAQAVGRPEGAAAPLPRGGPRRGARQGWCFSRPWSGWLVGRGGAPAGAARPARPPAAPPEARAGPRSAGPGRPPARRPAAR
jgi:hypothetical protein